MVDKEALLARLAATNDDNLLAQVQLLVDQWLKTDDAELIAELIRRDTKPDKVLISSEELWRRVEERYPAPADNA